MTTCPLCGAPAYIGFTVVECEGKGCKYYVPPKATTKTCDVTDVTITRDSLLSGTWSDPFAGISPNSGWLPSPPDAKFICDSIHNVLIPYLGYIHILTPTSGTQIESMLLSVLDSLVVGGWLPQRPAIDVRVSPTYSTFDCYFEKWFCDGMSAYGYCYLPIPP